MSSAGRPPWSQLAIAGVAIIAASAAIRVMPVRRLASILRHPPPDRLTAPPDEIAVICRAILAWSRRLPWRTMCFEQGLAAHWILRRRGFDSTLYYGAATIEGVLKAHVWVRSGDLDVVGCDEADKFALLARFPERQDADNVSAGSRRS